MTFPFYILKIYKINCSVICVYNNAIYLSNVSNNYHGELILPYYFHKKHLYRLIHNLIYIYFMQLLYGEEREVCFNS